MALTMARVRGLVKALRRQYVNAHITCGAPRARGGVGGASPETLAPYGPVCEHGAMPSLTPPVIPAGRLAGSVQPVLPIEQALSLRPWSVTDASAVITAYTDPDIRRWHARSVETEVEARSLIERWRSAWSAESGANWAIVRAVGVREAAHDVVLGRVSLRMIDTDQGRAECAYWIMPDARGDGIATKALSTLTAWAFAEAGFHRLFLVHSTANHASCRVATKAGFAAEGVERSSVLHTDGWHDMHVHARIAE
jgi:ribosomal-protein-alanine N-acetyltransferase